MLDLDKLTDEILKEWAEKPIIGGHTLTAKHKTGRKVRAILDHLASRGLIAQGWRPIEEASKKVSKGFIRLYSFKPERTGRDLKLSRCIEFSQVYGYRTCDLFIDIPSPPDGEKR